MALAVLFLTNSLHSGVREARTLKIWVRSADIMFEYSRRSRSTITVCTREREGREREKQEVMSPSIFTRKQQRHLPVRRYVRHAPPVQHKHLGCIGVCDQRQGVVKLDRHHVRIQAQLPLHHHRLLRVSGFRFRVWGVGFRV